jgi:hypothetical protein
MVSWAYQAVRPADSTSGWGGRVQQIFCDFVRGPRSRQSPSIGLVVGRHLVLMYGVAFLDSCGGLAVPLDAQRYAGITSQKQTYEVGECRQRQSDVRPTLHL